MEMNLKIKNLRKEKGITQEKLASLADVSLMTVRRWEWGETTPNSKKLTELANILGTTPEYLLNNSEKEDEKTQYNNVSKILDDTSFISEGDFIGSGRVLFYEKNGEKFVLPATPENQTWFRNLMTGVITNNTQIHVKEELA